MKNNKLNIIIYMLSILSFLGLFLIYPKLPAQIPTHWNISGTVNSYGSKNMIFLLGGIPIFIALLFHILPKIDPKRNNYSKYKQAYEIIELAVILVLILFVWITVAASLGTSIDISIIIPALIGILFVVLGNYLPRIRSNYFVGIRNPWTLADETVWKKTHKNGGYLFILCGILLLLTIFVSSDIKIFALILIIILLVIWINVYSYLLYRKISK